MPSDQGSTKRQKNTPQLVLVLQDASEEAAALAVLSALYGVKPLPELINSLSQEQQLQAAVLADMWAVPEVSTAAAEALEKAVESTSAGLSDEATSRLLGMAAVPSCLQPLLKQVLLSKYGDLEAVWQDAELQKQLLHLPLQAMELLLSCDELVVSGTARVVASGAC